MRRLMERAQDQGMDRTLGAEIRSYSGDALDLMAAILAVRRKATSEVAVALRGIEDKAESLATRLNTLARKVGGAP